MDCSHWEAICGSIERDPLLETIIVQKFLYFQEMLCSFFSDLEDGDVIMRVQIPYIRSSSISSVRISLTLMWLCG